MKRAIEEIIKELEEIGAKYREDKFLDGAKSGFKSGFATFSFDNDFHYILGYNRCIEDLKRAIKENKKTNKKRIKTNKKSS